MIKGSIQKYITIVEDIITIVNVYAPNIGGPQYIRQMLTAIKGEIDSNTILVGDFKIKNVRRDKEEHYVMIKGSIQEEDITIINI